MRRIALFRILGIVRRTECEELNCFDMIAKLSSLLGDWRHQSENLQLNHVGLFVSVVYDGSVDGTYRID